MGGQLQSYLNLTIGDNVQYSALREQVLQWDRSQQKWATSMVASSSADNQGPIVDRVQGAKGKDKKGKNEYQKGNWKHVQERLEVQRKFIAGKVSECDVRMTEIEYILDRKEKEEHQVDTLRSCTKRFHCGLILNGGSIEDEELDGTHRQADDMIAEANAANYLARRSLEDLRSASGQVSGLDTLLKAASPGAILSDGPASTSFRSGNPECTNSMEYEQEQRH